MEQGVGHGVAVFAKAGQVVASHEHGIKAYHTSSQTLNTPPPLMAQVLQRLERPDLLSASATCSPPAHSP